MSEENREFDTIASAFTDRHPEVNVVDADITDRDLEYLGSHICVGEEWGDTIGFSYSVYDSSVELYRLEARCTDGAETLDGLDKVLEDWLAETKKRGVTRLYLDGKPIETPEVTELEARLLSKLEGAGYGDLENQGLVSTWDDEWCGYGGLERVNMIDWDDRRQLGALIENLQDKNLVIFEECDDGNGNILWFDCNALQEVVQAHEVQRLRDGFDIGGREQVVPAIPSHAWGNDE